VCDFIPGINVHRMFFLELPFAGKGVIMGWLTMNDGLNILDIY
jgi:hypothetical protein